MKWMSTLRSMFNDSVALYQDYIEKQSFLVRPGAFQAMCYYFKFVMQECVTQFLNNKENNSKSIRNIDLPEIRHAGYNLQKGKHITYQSTTYLNSCTLTYTCIDTSLQNKRKNSQLTKHLSFLTLRCESVRPERPSVRLLVYLIWGVNLPSSGFWVESIKHFKFDDTNKRFTFVHIKSFVALLVAVCLCVCAGDVVGTFGVQKVEN